MEVMMPVRALNDGCLRCPELDIQVDQMQIYDGGGYESIRTQLYCSHFKRCAMILKNIEKEISKDAENSTK